MLHKTREAKKEASGVIAAGFTIIEVMIVLAIAGLIMAIVFLAIPGLQRNNRNTQRKSDAARLAGLVNDYIANNNGKIPAGTWDGVTPAVNPGSTYINLTNESFSIMTKPAAAINASANPFAGTLPTTDTPLIVKNADCSNASNIPVYNVSTRTYAITFFIEGNTTKTQCISG